MKISVAHMDRHRVRHCCYMLIISCTLKQLRRLPCFGWVVYSGTVSSLRRFEFPCETESRLLGRGEYSSYGLETCRLSIPCRVATGFLGSDCGWCGVGPQTPLPTTISGRPQRSAGACAALPPAGSFTFSRSGGGGFGAAGVYPDRLGTGR